MTGTVPISCDSSDTSSQGNVSPPDLPLNQSVLPRPRRYPGPVNNDSDQMEFEVLTNQKYSS